MQVHRVKRTDFCAHPVATHDPQHHRIAIVKKNKASCAAHRIVLASGVCFVFACVGFLAFFLSQSNIVSTGTTLVGVARIKCRRDRDCAARLRADYDDLNWGQCLHPPNETSKCVDKYCVDPPPVPVESADACDDGLWCTVNDKCVPGKGVCKGVMRSCHDVDFCTLETCAEDLKSCVAMDATDVPETCENTCTGDEDCRHEFYCAHGRCANFQARNSSLFFAAYEIQPCPDDPNAYAMVQHYIVYEQGYSLDLKEGHTNRGMRYRALKTAEGVKFPPAPNGEIPLVSASGAQTRIIPKTATTPGYSEITVSVKTACQAFPDSSACLTKWMNRRYDFDLYLQDCVVHKDDPLGTEFGTTLGECLPIHIERSFTMNLDVIDCPKFPKFSGIPPLLSLRFQYGGNEKTAITHVAQGDWVQAVIEMDETQQQLFPILADQSPFLTSAVVCGVDPFHRLAACALNDPSADCPIRGCRGWTGTNNDDSPLIWYRDYMDNADRLSAAVSDGVQFCRGVGYEMSGCVPNKCDWGVNSKQPVFGSADGFMFSAAATVGETIVADVQFRMQYCGANSDPNAAAATGTTGGSSRRLSQPFPERAVAIFKVKKKVSDFDDTHV